MVKNPLLWLIILKHANLSRQNTLLVLGVFYHNDD